LPQLAVLFECGLIVLFELVPQLSPLLDAGKDMTSAASCRVPGFEVIALTAALDPAFDGRAGDSEEVRDLLARQAPVHCGKHP
jgi:hypothetical protein